MACRPNSEDLNKEIGERLRELRLRSGMTQQELGAAIGVSYVQIQKYENGKNRIAVSTLIVICQALNSGPMDFIGRYFETGKLRTAVNHQLKLRCRRIAP
ncbi:helix-turn-helix domain-containing protein [Phyllobacterium sophorae]|uniref:XRE family transcriptional regulator n=1 Tax=Phyllobacterium sophorae TaxID=1520277 RepID=A0A2P7B383_9HYPH|nr:XRE family transcriptional regulator [Phyllobacterium sophorae]